MIEFPLSTRLVMTAFFVAMPVSILIAMMTKAVMRAAGLSLRAQVMLGWLGICSAIGSTLVVVQLGLFNQSVVIICYFLLLLFLALGALNEWAGEKVASREMTSRSYRTEADEYDLAKLGWRFTVQKGDGDKPIATIEKRKIYDTTNHGRGKEGHTFDGHLLDEKRSAIIECLKTI